MNDHYKMSRVSISDQVTIHDSKYSYNVDNYKKKPQSQINDIPIFYPEHKISKLNIILDVDETLLHSIDRTSFPTDCFMANPSLHQRMYTMEFVMKKNIEIMWGVLRPWTREFLAFCNRYFNKVIIWSAGMADYVKQAVEILYHDIKQPDYVLSQIEYKKQGNQKPINYITNYVDPDINLKNTLIIDDQPVNAKSNPLNLIRIPIYDLEGTFENVSKTYDYRNLIKDDNRLEKLANWFLTSEVMNCSDVKKLEKRKIF